MFYWGRCPFQKNIELQPMFSFSLLTCTRMETKIRKPKLDTEFLLGLWSPSDIMCKKLSLFRIVVHFESDWVVVHVFHTFLDLYDNGL